MVMVYGRSSADNPAFSAIAISSWCSTERQGDTSESVVFHFLLLGVWDRCLFVCVWLLCFVCFVCWFP